MAIKNRLKSSRLFEIAFENINKLIANLKREDKELNNQMKNNLDINLIANCALVNEKFNELNANNQSIYQSIYVDGRIRKRI